MTSGVTKDEGCQYEPPPVCNMVPSPPRPVLVPLKHNVSTQAYYYREKNKNKAIQVQPIQKNVGVNTRFTEDIPYREVNRLNSVMVYMARKYVVYEDCLLPLFKTCPVCRGSCSIDKFIQDTLLTINRFCNHCDHQSQWKSQPFNLPAGYLSSSAAKVSTGTTGTSTGPSTDAQTGTSTGPSTDAQTGTSTGPSTDAQTGTSTGPSTDAQTGTSTGPSTDAQTGTSTGPSTDAQTGTSTGPSTDAQTGTSTGPSTDAQTGTSTGPSTDAQTGTSTGPSTDAQTGTSTGPSTDAQTGTSTGPSTDAQTGTSTGPSTDAQTGTSTGPSTDAQTDTSTGPFTDAQTGTSTGSFTDAQTGTSTGQTGTFNAQTLKTAEESGLLLESNDGDICNKGLEDIQTLVFETTLCLDDEVHDNKSIKNQSLEKEEQKEVGEEEIMEEETREEESSDSEWEPEVELGQLLASDSEGDSPALCPDCGTFTKGSKVHVCEHVKPFVCQDCGKRFVNEVSLNIHRRIHKPGYVHECKYCLKPLQSRPEKLRHEESHPRVEKPYECPDCPKRFSDIKARDSHIQGHRGPTQHICNICKMEFNKKHILERHMLVHSGDKSYICPECQRSFNQASHLKSHMRLHTGERPYKCQQCDKSFNHNVSLKSHVQRYHPGLGYGTKETVEGQEPISNSATQTEQQVRLEESRQPNTETGQKRVKRALRAGRKRKRQTFDPEEFVESKNNSDSEFNPEEEESGSNSDSDFNPEEEESGSKRRTTGRPIGRPKGRPGTTRKMHARTVGKELDGSNLNEHKSAKQWEQEEERQSDRGEVEERGSKRKATSSGRGRGRGRGRPKTIRKMHEGTACEELDGSNLNEQVPSIETALSELLESCWPIQNVAFDPMSN